MSERYTQPFEHYMKITDKLQLKSYGVLQLLTHRVEIS